MNKFRNEVHYMSKGMLEGVRIVEMARYISGPFAAMTLADMGADVIKIEKKGHGDDTRFFPPFKNGENLYFPTFKRNKRSLEINYRDPEDIKILEKLLKTADVLIENFRPGMLAKMGLSRERLHEINPRLIVADISGFGQDGPYKNRGGFDWIAQAMGGFMSVTGTEESGPLVAGIPMADEVTSMYAIIGIMTALYNRERTGKGEFIDVSLMDSLASLMQTYIPRYDALNDVAPLAGFVDPVVHPAKRFKASDGYVYIHAGTDALYVKLAAYLNDPVLMDEKYNLLANRIPDKDKIYEIIEKWTMEHTCDELDAEMEKIGVPCGIVNNMERVCKDPQLAHRKTLVRVEVDNVGDVLFPGPAVKFASDGEKEYRRAPRLGEHNEEILKELENVTID